MKVWIATQQERYPEDGSVILGVYGSREKAVSAHPCPKGWEEREHLFPEKTASGLLCLPEVGTGNLLYQEPASGHYKLSISICQHEVL